MEEIIKTYLGMFFLVALVCLGFGLISSSIIARSANNLACQYSSKIVNSNISDSVIESCKNEVTSNAIDAYDDLLVDLSTNEDGKKTGVMTLKYHYTIPLLGIRSNKEIKRMLM